MAFGDADYSNLTDLAIDPVSGRILVSADFPSPYLSSYSQYGVARLLSSGSLDTSFGEDGRWMTSLDDQQMTSSAIQIQSDGKIVVSGSVDHAGLLFFSFFATRLLPTGERDPSFAGGGDADVYFDPLFGYADSRVHGATLQAGKIVLAGSNIFYEGVTSGAVARLWSAHVFSDGFERGDRTGWTLSTP